MVQARLWKTFRSRDKSNDAAGRGTTRKEMVPSDVESSDTNSTDDSHSHNGPSHVCRVAHFVLYDAPEEAPPVSLQKAIECAGSDVSALSMLSAAVFSAQLREDIEQACYDIRRHIDSELSRQRDENLINYVILDGEIALARYEHHSVERGAILGMKRYMKSKAEYERSLAIVRQLQDLEEKIRCIEDYSDQSRLLEKYEGVIRRILDTPTTQQETADLDRDLLDELSSGKVQAYITSLTGSETEIVSFI
jgi:hypothetical protein